MHRDPNVGEVGFLYEDLIFVLSYKKTVRNYSLYFNPAIATNANAIAIATSIAIAIAARAVGADPGCCYWGL